MSNVETPVVATSEIESKLMDLDKEFQKLETEMQIEINRIQRKYMELQKPNFEERRTLLTAAPAEDAAGTEETGTPALSKFWLTALLNHPYCAHLINHCDHPVLAYLTDIQCELLDASEEDISPGFKLSFHFATNPYFEESVLVKSFLADSCTGTPITWKPGMNVTRTVVQRKQRNKKTNEVRVISAEEENASFFSLFNSYEYDKVQSSDLDVIDSHHEICMAIRDRIIPRAITWYQDMGEDSNLDVSDNDDDLDGLDVDGGDMDEDLAKISASNPQCEQQ